MMEISPESNHQESHVPRVEDQEKHTDTFIEGQVKVASTASVACSQSSKDDHNSDTTTMIKSCVQNLKYGADSDSHEATPSLIPMGDHKENDILYSNTHMQLAVSETIKVNDIQKIHSNQKFRDHVQSFSAKPKTMETPINREIEVDLVEDSETEEDYEDSLIIDDEDDFLRQNKSTCASPSSLPSGLKTTEAVSKDQTFQTCVKSTNENTTGNTVTSTSTPATYSIDPSILRAEMMKMLPDLLKELHKSSQNSNTADFESKATDDSTKPSVDCQYSGERVEFSVRGERSVDNINVCSPLPSAPESLRKEQSGSTSLKSTLGTKNNSLNLKKRRNRPNEQKQMKSESNSKSSYRSVKTQNKTQKHPKIPKSSTFHEQDQQNIVKGSCAMSLGIAKQSTGASQHLPHLMSNVNISHPQYYPRTFTSVKDTISKTVQAQADQSIRKAMAAVKFGAECTSANQLRQNESSDASITSMDTSQLTKTSCVFSSNATKTSVNPCAVRFVGKCEAYKTTPQHFLSTVRPVQQNIPSQNKLPRGNLSILQNTNGKNIFADANQSSQSVNVIQPFPAPHSSKQTFPNSAFPRPPVSNVASISILSKPTQHQYQPTQPAVSSAPVYSSDRDQATPQITNVKNVKSMQHKYPHLKNDQTQLKKHMRYAGTAVASRIIDCKVTNGEKYFKIEWIGFSWEKESLIVQSDLMDLLASYENGGGTMNWLQKQKKADWFSRKAKKICSAEKPTAVQSTKIETPSSEKAKCQWGNTPHHQISLIRNIVDGLEKTISQDGSCTPNPVDEDEVKNSQTEILSSNYMDALPASNNNSEVAPTTQLPDPPAATKVSFNDGPNQPLPKVAAILSAYEPNESKDIGYREFDFASCLDSSKKVRKSPSGEVLEKCSFCNLKFTSAELSRHHRIYERNFCPQCHVRICNRRNLRKHILLHNRLVYQCSTCLRSFCDEKRFKLHRKTNHTLAELETAKKEKPNLIKCNACNKRIPRGICWRQHQRKHKMDAGQNLQQCPICKKQFKLSKNLECHLTAHRLSFKECVQCLECFDFDEDATKHECSGKPNIRYISVYDNIVSKPSRKRPSILRHRLFSFQRQRKRRSCLQCIRGFKCRDNFYEHVSIDGCANLEETRECFSCKQTFHSLNDLKAHVTNCFKESLKKLFRPKSRSDDESGEQQSTKKHMVYHCVKCTNLFPSLEFLHRHRRIFHPSREKYKCFKCGFSCLSRALLKRHLKKGGCTAQPGYYRCFMCDQNRVHYAAFSSLPSLIAHFQSHKAVVKTPAHKNSKQSIHPVSSSVDKVQIKPALITNRSGKKMLLSVSTKVIERLRGQPGLCEVPDFGTYKVQVEGSPPCQCLTATVWSDVHSDSSTDSVPSGDEKKLVLSCFDCHAQYSTRRLMVKHFKSFHRWRFIHLTVCNDCNIAFREKMAYDNHHNAVHSSKQQVMIGQSGISKSKSFAEKTPVIDDSSYDERCAGVSLPDGRNLENEAPLPTKQSLENVPPKNGYHCQTCDVLFTNRTDYQVHNKLPPNVTVCTLCDTPFFNKALYFVHYSKYHIKNSQSKLFVKHHMKIVDITWPCFICQQKISHSDLSSHVQEHVVFECYLCNVKVSSRKLIIHHLNQVHGTARSIKEKAWLNRVTNGLQILESIYKNVSARDPPLQGSSLQCSRCNAVFFYKDTLELHMQLSCPSSDVLKRCPSSDGLKPNSLQNDSHYCWFPYEMNDVIDKTRYLFTCKLCFAMFDKEDDFNDHMFASHYMKKSSTKLFSQTNFSENVLKQRFKAGTAYVFYRCHLCGLKFSDEMKSIKHAFLHLGSKLYECGVCGDSFVFMEELRFHYNIVHRCYFCMVCHKTFHKMADLRHHSQLHVLEVNIPRDQNDKMVIEVERNPEWLQMKRKLFPNDTSYQPQFAVTSKISPDILGDVRLFFCRVCKKNIEGELTFIVHMKTHAHPRAFHCLVCRKEFACQEKYELHFSKHFDETGLVLRVTDPSLSDDIEAVEEGDFHCNICFQVFETKQALDDHSSLVAKENAGDKEHNVKLGGTITDIIWRYCCGEADKRSECLEWQIGERYNLKELFLMLQQRSLSKQEVCHAKYVPPSSLFHVCPFCKIKVEDKESHLQRHISLTKPDHLKCVYCISFECEAGKLFDHVKEMHKNKIHESFTSCPYCYAAGDDVTPDHFELHQKKLPPSCFFMHCAYCNLQVPSTFLHFHNLTMWEIEHNGCNENETVLSFARRKLKTLPKFRKIKNSLAAPNHHVTSASLTLSSSKADKRKVNAATGSNEHSLTGSNEHSLIDFTVTSTPCSSIITSQSVTPATALTAVTPVTADQKKQYISSIANMLMGGLEDPVCSICHWKYNTFGDLKEHLASHLSHPTVDIKYNSRDACCVFCKVLVRRTSMKTHLKMKHPKETEQHEKLQNFACQNSRSTKTKSKVVELEIVERDHNSNVRPYPFNCQCCSKGYFSSSALLTHVQYAHPVLYEEERKRFAKPVKRNLKQNSPTQAKKSRMGNATTMKGETNSTQSKLTKDKGKKSSAKMNREKTNNLKQGFERKLETKVVNTQKSLKTNTGGLQDNVIMQAQPAKSPRKVVHPPAKSTRKVVHPPAKSTRKIVRPGKPPISFKENCTVKSPNKDGENNWKNEKRNVLPNNIDTNAKNESAARKVLSKSELKSEPIKSFARKEADDVRKQDDLNITKTSDPPVGATDKNNESDDEMVGSEDEDGVKSETEEEIIESSSENEEIEIKKKANTPNATTYKCPTCSLNFPCQTELESHVTVHQVQQQHDRYFSIPYPYICVYCGVGYYNTSALRKHLQGKHELVYKPDLEKDETFINRSVGVAQDHQNNSCHDEALNLPKRDRSSFKDVLARVKNSRKKKISGNARVKLATSKLSAVRSSSRKRTMSEDVKNFLQKRKTPKKSAKKKIGLPKTPAKKSSIQKSESNTESNRDDAEKSRSALTSSESDEEMDDVGKESDGTQSESGASESDHSTEESSNREKPLRKEKLACQYCDLILTNQRTLKKHEEVHTKNLSSKDVFQMSCTQCHEVMPRHKLKRHMHTKHPSAVLLKERNYCLYCDYTTKKDLEKHMLSNHPELLKVECRLCDVRFSTQSRYKKHFRKIHGKAIDEVSLECFTCNKRFQSISGLHYHYSIVHMHKDENLYCQLCSKFFYDQTHLDKHEKEYHKNDKFQCGLCLVEFNNVEKCEVHIQDHKKKTNWLCEVCGFYFESELVLREHQKSHGDQKFTCDVCDEILYGVDSFRRHKTVRHGGSPSRNLNCVICSLQLENVDELVKHERNHSLQSNYECSACEKTFSDLLSIQNHMTDVHHGGAPAILKSSEEELNDSNDNAVLAMNECRICGETFLRYEIYAQHMKNHQ